MAQYYIPQETTSPEIISLDLAKAHLKVDFDTDDELIMEYIKAAIDEAERYTQTDLKEQDYEVQFDEWVNYYQFKVGPVQAISAITYTPEVGAEQTIPEADYAVLPADKYAHVLEFIDFDELPTIKEKTKIKISLTCGYASGKVPAAIKSALLLLIANFYENREDKVHNLPSRVQSLLRPYRFYY